VLGEDGARLIRTVLGQVIPAGSDAAARARRLTDAAGAALARVATAAAAFAEDEMFASVGETLTWLIALEDLVASVYGPRYWAKRNADADGAVLPGIRYARNAVVHGVAVTAAVDSHSGAMLGVAALGAFALGEGPSDLWRDRTSIGFTPTPSRHLAEQERSYDNELAGQDVLLSLEQALTFLRDAART